MGKPNKVTIKAMDRRDFPTEKSLKEASFRDGRYIGTVTSEGEFYAFLNGNFIESTKLTFWDQNKMQITEEQAKELLQLNSI